MASANARNPQMAGRPAYLVWRLGSVEAQTVCSAGPTDSLFSLTMEDQDCGFAENLIS
jgi:hypothetical protein